MRRFPRRILRRLDRERAYPTEFVAALTKAGFLAALIPEQYGGSGLTMTAAAAIMEEIQASGCNGAPCHAQMYTMGTLLRHGSAAQKERYLPGIAGGDLRLQAFGVTEPTSGRGPSAACLGAYATAPGRFFGHSADTKSQPQASACASITSAIANLVARPKRGGDNHANTMYFLKNLVCLPRI